MTTDLSPPKILIGDIGLKARKNQEARVLLHGKVCAGFALIAAQLTEVLFAETPDFESAREDVTDSFLNQLLDSPELTIAALPGVLHGERTAGSLLDLHTCDNCSTSFALDTDHLSGSQKQDGYYLCAGCAAQYEAECAESAAYEARTGRPDYPEFERR